MSSTSLSLAGPNGTAPKPQSMPLRLAENFFRRWFLIALPLLIMASIGVLMAQRVTENYQANATWSASANPLIEQQEIRGLSANFRETAAAATARVINERLATDRFAAGVADRAGLSTAVENGLLGYGDIRTRIRVFPIGESLISVEVMWSDPETALVLIDATLDQYRSILQATVSTDAQSAVEFYESRRAEAVVAATTAREEYAAFEAGLPPLLGGDDLPATDQLELQRLFGRLIAAESAIADADSEIEGARLSVVQTQSEVGRSIEIIDPADSSFTPQSALMNRAVILLGFVLLGGLISLTILVLSTVLDRSVRSAADIAAAGGGATVAAVPRIKSLVPRRGLRRLLNRRESKPDLSQMAQAA